MAKIAKKRLHARGGEPNPKTNALAEKKIYRLSPAKLLALASQRTDLPDVEMELDYQDDVDTLCIIFKKPIGDDQIAGLDDELGVLPIYNPSLTKLVGIEILNISGQLEYANPT